MKLSFKRVSSSSDCFAVANNAPGLILSRRQKSIVILIFIKSMLNKRKPVQQFFFSLKTHCLFAELILLTTIYFLSAVKHLFTPQSGCITFSLRQTDK